MNINIKGRTFDVVVSEQGMFSAECDGIGHSKPTLRALKDTLSRIASSKPISIKVLVEKHYSNTGFRPAIIVGRHSGNNNLLVKWRATDRETEQIRRYTSVYRNDMNVDKLKALIKAKKTAEEAYEEFLRKNTLHHAEIDKMIDGLLA